MRSDLAPGLQMAQAIHAAVALTMEHPERVAVTPNVVVLNVPDERTLLEYADACPSPAALFAEPDIGNEYTAFACISDGRALSSLPLAGREVAMT